MYLQLSEYAGGVLLAAVCVTRAVLLLRTC
jgi:hypothetical protein